MTHRHEVLSSPLPHKMCEALLPHSPHKVCEETIHTQQSTQSVRAAAQSTRTCVSLTSCGVRGCSHILCELLCVYCLVAHFVRIVWQLCVVHLAWIVRQLAHFVWIQSKSSVRQKSPYSPGVVIHCNTLQYDAALHHSAMGHDSSSWIRMVWNSCNSQPAEVRATSCNTLQHAVATVSQCVPSCIPLSIYIDRDVPLSDDRF